jgi:hypothetical protein
MPINDRPVVDAGLVLALRGGGAAAISTVGLPKITAVVDTALKKFRREISIVNALKVRRLLSIK